MAIEIDGARTWERWWHQMPRWLTVLVSALPPKAAAAVADRRVRYWPIADIVFAARSEMKEAAN
jgi:hypothetical protein